MENSIHVTCPSCTHEFSLNEGVIASVRDDLSKEMQGELAQRERDLTARLDAVRRLEADIKREKAVIDEEIETKVADLLRVKEAEIRAKADERATEARNVEIRELQEELAEKRESLAEARRLELELRCEKRKLQEAKENISLEIERKLDQEREKILEHALKQADEKAHFKLAEKDKLISELKAKMDDLQRKVEQGCVQTQGEVYELDLEQQLRQAFPVDQMNPVSVGTCGADITLEVISQTGRSCGIVLFESKRTKAWKDEWITKLHGDMRAARADLGVIVTETLPKGIQAFGERDGIWVTDFASAIPLVSVLRATLHEVMIAKGHREGAKEKMELLYEYLTGNEFRQRVMQVMKVFGSMRRDLDNERAYFARNLNKREKHISLVIDSMSGMLGDVHALSGGAVQSLPAPEMDEESEERSEE